MDCEIAVCLKASALVTVTHRTMYWVLAELSRLVATSLLLARRGADVGRLDRSPPVAARNPLPP